MAPQSVTAQVRLDDPECDALAFDPIALRRVVELELSLQGLGLSAAGPTHVTYVPTPCARGATTVRLRVERASHIRESIADLSQVPLGAVARVIALELVQLISAASNPSSAPHYESAPDAALQTDAPLSVIAEPNPVGSSESSQVTLRPEPVGATVGDSPQGPAGGAPEPEGEEPSAHAATVILGAAASSRNTPDTGGLLGGLRLFVELPFAADFPLSARLDGSTSFGSAPPGLALGWVEAGLSLLLRADALPEMGIRFGPRAWVGCGFVVSAGNGSAMPTGEAIQVGVGVRAGVDIALAEGLSLTLDVEVGSNLTGFELDTPSGRSGLLGAYWGADIGLSWAL